MTRQRRRGLALLLLLSLVAVTGCTAGHETVRLDVSPAQTRMDEPVAVRVSGLLPGKPVDLVLRSADAAGKPWTSRATFTADADGTVDPAAVAPSTGSYAGVDATGLLSSLRPDGPASTYRWPDVGPASFDVSVERDGRTLATARAERTFWVERPVLRTFTQAHDGFVGTYVRPAGTVARGPAVLVLGGSEGGDPAFSVF